MSPNKGPKVMKYCVIISTFALILIAISIIPISKRALLWNRCLDQTLSWINERSKDVEEWEKKAKESIAVGICNGAVYQDNLR